MPVLRSRYAVRRARARAVGILYLAAALCALAAIAAAACEPALRVFP